MFLIAIIILVIRMKEYYVFLIRDEFVKLYSSKSSDLFYIFNRIYYMKEMDKMYGYNLFSQISYFFNKDDVNEFLIENLLTLC